MSAHLKFLHQTSHTVSRDERIGERAAAHHGFGVRGLRSRSPGWSASHQNYLERPRRKKDKLDDFWRAAASACTQTRALHGYIKNILLLVNFGCEKGSGVGVKSEEWSGC
jgi:hypothetical protein